MSNFQLTYQPFGERSILIEWPAIIDIAVLKDIIIFKEKIETAASKINYTKSAYNSLLVNFKFPIKNLHEEISVLKNLYLSKYPTTKKPSFLWKIPVCYDEQFGIDLEEISKSKGLPKEEIIRLHTEKIYTVFFIGFLPGFLYLGGLNEKISFPRRSSPRLQLPKGAVGIGGNQTGIYPCQSPGGWNVIGNSPILFFDKNKAIPCFAKPGDQVQFYPISIKEHQEISTSVEANIYQMEKESSHD